jgi:hypothetical protein
MKTPTSNIPSIGPLYADDLHLELIHLQLLVLQKPFIVMEIQLV